MSILYNFVIKIDLESGKYVKKHTIENDKDYSSRKKYSVLQITLIIPEIPVYLLPTLVSKIFGINVY